jgi:hypothetical protein
MQPGVAHDYIVFLPETGDCEEGFLGMIFVSQDKLGHLGNVASLIGGAIYISKRDWSGQFPSGETVCLDVFTVYEHSSGPGI